MKYTKTNLYCTHCTTPKRVSSLRSPCQRHCANAAEGNTASFEEIFSGGEPLGTVRRIRAARDLDLNDRPPTPETNALPLWPLFETP